MYSTNALDHTSLTASGIELASMTGYTRKRTRRRNDVLRSEVVCEEVHISRGRCERSLRIACFMVIPTVRSVDVGLLSAISGCS